MASVNKVILVGNLGKDPEVRFTKGGQAVANFSIATSEKWTDKESGNKEEKTEWHNIIAWGKLGEVCGEYLTKGKQVYIEGKLQTSNWEDKDDGKLRYKTEIVASNMTMLGHAGGGHDAPESTGSSQSQRPPEDDDGDIPF